MTNLEIIIAEGLLNHTAEELHTFSRWKAMGYAVKKGEHGIETRLWKKSKKKADAPEDADEETKKKYNDGFYLAKSFLFKRSQVEPIKGKEVVS